MRTLMRTSMMAMFLAALALAPGCEDTLVETLALSATPLKVTIGSAETSGKTTIAATIEDTSGVGQAGRTVSFSTSSSSTEGTLDPGTDVTDAAGVASSVLTVTRTAPSSITVTATSGTLRTTVIVTVVVVAP